MMQPIRQYWEGEYDGGWAVAPHLQRCHQDPLPALSICGGGGLNQLVREGGAAVAQAAERLSQQADGTVTKRLLHVTGAQTGMPSLQNVLNASMSTRELPQIYSRD